MERRRPRLTVFGINYEPEPVGIGPYTTELARGLGARGWDVTVVTGHPHYPAWRRGQPPAQHNGSSPLVVRAWHHVPRTPGLVGRGMMEASWAVTGARRAIGHDSDVVLGVIPSLSGGLLAASAGLLRRVPFVLHIQDLVGQALAQAQSRRVLPRAIETVEIALARRAAGIAVVSPGMGDHLVRSGVDRDRIRCVRNWSRMATPSLGRAAARAKLNWPLDRFIVLHSGSIGAKQGLDALVDVARAAKAGGDDDLLFIIRGDGAERRALTGRLRDACLDNLWLLPLADEDTFAATLAAADVTLVYQRPEVTNMALPSKLTTYFAAGRPVVAAVDRSSEAAREVRRSGAGIVVRPGDAAAALAALRHLRAQPSRAAELGAHGMAYAADTLRADAAIDAFGDLLLRAANGRRGPFEPVEGVAVR